MGIRIIVCGLNGAGKSTLGKALAEELGYYFIDNEFLYFPKSDSDYQYDAPLTKEEANIIFESEVRLHENFVFAAVRGDYGKEVSPNYTYAVLIEVPKDIRMERITNRSFQKFGKRMMADGDLYKKEQAFFEMASNRPGDYVEKWIHTLNCPVIRVDGTMPVQDNISYILKFIEK